MRMIKYFVVCMLFVSAMGCKGKEKIPNSVLSKEKMQVVLADMMKADQFLSDYVLNRDTTKKKEKESLKMYDQVFAIHNITAEKFYKSFKYYQQHPAFLQPMLDSLSKPAEAMKVDAVPVDAITPEMKDTINVTTEIQPISDSASRLRADSSVKRKVKTLPALRY